MAIHPTLDLGRQTTVMLEASERRIELWQAFGDGTELVFLNLEQAKLLRDWLVEVLKDGY